MMLRAMLHAFAACFFSLSHEETIEIAIIYLALLPSSTLVTERHYAERIRLYLFLRRGLVVESKKLVTIEFDTRVDAPAVDIVIHLHDWRVFVPGVRAMLAEDLREFLEPHRIFNVGITVEVRP